MYLFTLNLVMVYCPVESKLLGHQIKGQFNSVLNVTFNQGSVNTTPQIQGHHIQLCRLFIA